MLPDQVSNPGPLTYESGALPIVLRGPAAHKCSNANNCWHFNIYELEKYHSRLIWAEYKPNFLIFLYL